jgi:methylenetetrahydrofolate reductase (NADPH)
MTDTSTSTDLVRVLPPRSAETEAWSVVKRLKPLGATFFSVTCGAGGSTKGPTLATLRHLAEESGLPAAGHLVREPPRDVNETIDDY